MNQKPIDQLNLDLSARRPYPSAAALAMGRAMQLAGQERGDQEMVAMGKRREQQALEAIRRGLSVLPDDVIDRPIPPRPARQLDLFDDQPDLFDKL
jgi:hypothetical protein